MFAFVWNKTEYVSYFLMIMHESQDMWYESNDNENYNDEWYSDNGNIYDKISK